MPTEREHSPSTGTECSHFLCWLVLCVGSVPSSPPALLVYRAALFLCSINNCSSLSGWLYRHTGPERPWSREGTERTNPVVCIETVDTFGRVCTPISQTFTLLRLLDFTCTSDGGSKESEEMGSVFTALSTKTGLKPVVVISCSANREHAYTHSSLPITCVCAHCVHTLCVYIHKSNRKQENAMF